MGYHMDGVPILSEDAESTTVPFPPYMGLDVTRFYTQAAKRDPYATIAWEKRDSQVRGSDGRIIEVLHGIEVPAGWSQTASDVLAQKYLRRRGVPSNTVRVTESGVPDWLQRSIPADNDGGEGRETSARQVFDRLAGAWTYWGWSYGYFKSEADAHAYFDEMRYMLAAQVGAPNSPQWFNTGLHWAYGIAGRAQGHFVADHEMGEVSETTGAYVHPQPSACFIQSVDDDLVNDNGIMDLWMREARLFKYGSGTGSNFSALRGAGETLSGGGRSSGLMSFLKIGDTAAGAIKSGGTTRRAAKMVIVDANHPDIETFVDWKVVEERKVAAIITGSHVIETHLNAILTAVNEGGMDPRRNSALADAIRDADRVQVPHSYIRRVIQLAEQGADAVQMERYTSDFDGPAFETISGQNANTSVRVDNAFMAAVAKDAPWHLRARTTGDTVRTLPSRQLWARIARATWECADPGIQYDTTINEWHTCPNSGRINASNPCSEYMFLDDTACNLGSLNLMNLRDEDGALDVAAMEHACRLWTLTLEITVAMGAYPSRRIAERSWRYRTLGLGYANLGGLLMASGLAYDSPEGRAMAGAITALMSGVSYATSAEMASKLGAFPGYAENREPMLRVIRNHRRAARGETDGYEELSVAPVVLDHANLPDARLGEAAVRAWDSALEQGKAHGYRNAQVSVIAPTGTIGLVMDCDTTGIEPDFALVKFKKMVGGGHFKIINRTVPDALRRLGYNEEQITAIENHIIGHRSFARAPGLDPAALRSRYGFSDAEIDALESAAPGAFNIRLIFNEHVLGHRFVRDLGVSEADLADPGFDLLTYLGVPDEIIDAADKHVCGHATIESAPYIEDSHLAVFDTAMPAGTGVRSLLANAHIDMVAAVQPFISGAISKTVNMPASASVMAVQDAYERAHQLGLKAVALYREGAKLSQPLSTAQTDTLIQTVCMETGLSDSPPLLSGRLARSRKPLKRQSGARVNAGGCRRAAVVTARKLRWVARKSIFTPVNTKTARSVRSSSTCTRRGRPSAR